MRYVVEFDETYRGFRILGLFRDHGYRCGYVQIPNDILPKVQEDAEQDSECVPVNVHGGVTFAGYLKDFDEFFIGFDCAHYGDLQDIESWKTHFPEEYAKIKKYLDHPNRRGETVKTKEFVREECYRMIDQIIDIYYEGVTP